MIENQLQELIDVNKQILEALTVGNTASTVPKKTTTAPKKETETKTEEKPKTRRTAKKKAEEETTTVTVTLNAIRAKCTKVVDALGRDTVVDILADMDAMKVGDLDESQYPELAEALDKALTDA